MTKAQAAPKISYDHGVSDKKLIGETIGVFFDRTVETHRDREALVVRHQNVRWSWGELGRRVDDLAAGLLTLGLERGDRVGIWSPNTSEWTLAQFATAKAGLVLVNVNPAYRRAELDYAMNKVECKALILAPALKTSNYLEIVEDLVKARKLPHLKHVIRLGPEKTPGMLNFNDVATAGGNAEKARIAELAPKLQFDDAINIQFTSGTTGFPKGATLSHHNILNNGYFVGEGLKLTPEDRLCIPVPLYHCFGMVMGNLGCLTHGSTMIYPSEAFDPLATLQAVAEERCTALYGVPTMFIAQLDHPDFAKFDLKSLRTGIMAGSPCPIEVMKKVQSHMHMGEVTIAYGMTETSPVSTQCATDDPVERRVSTVGQVLPHIEIKIVDTEGRAVPRGETGEFCTRGYSVMKGYWNDEAKTREAVDEAGWMRTGDLATMDEEGYVNIVGRLKDMIIRGGENVYPREIEEFLYRHPKVQDVQVIGVPDLRYGEAVCAWIKLHAGQTATDEEIRTFCQGQIAHYKIPRYIEFVPEFPMTITGKIQKFVMREQTIEKLGLTAQKTA
ncbi:AMP-binding protein [Reyranella sp.]|jgi:fatty-acyl-CoA synthase|uniref:AMP-binding protein n=1 Tax=Reyranella sp. TaxID=1929291 RepID=UPI000BD45257|nr:AMP-binding protein [Reyranella sp.]OYY39860.1 MAG: AMP-binding protein [Rhodospirillales bacterium 35-66-84]OYZ92304.1 MAG: AMP-binding protein [Rhodospirillales bacterium 24-66-33]OZB22231.1 MAG: AMP-binding protein [Rhodospirillales bacterium 39-66-50]HQS17850.1 AMP-binding protein [Reyranella sp.]HQT14135.1 AMP-binding protein [Reyranella sp.]